jgi:hypothetical protein
MAPPVWIVRNVDDNTPSNASSLKASTLAVIIILGGGYGGLMMIDSVDSVPLGGRWCVSWLEVQDAGQNNGFFPRSNGSVNFRC